MGNRNFYRDLPALHSFAEATNSALHSPLPADWWVVLADVQGSTRAIESGRYKDVNTVAAATIMAVINVDRSCEIPFIFGGDGATIAVPPIMVEAVKGALLGAKKMAKDGFGLELRVALMPATEILAKDMRLGVCKYKHSEKIFQTSFSGFGWAWAEAMMKDEKAGQKYLIKDDGSIQENADFTGFECRWKPVKARLESKLAIIVQCMEKNPDLHSKIYNGVLQEVQKIYGDVAEYHPLAESKLGLTTSLARLKGEAIVRAKKRTAFSYLLGSVVLAVISVVGTIAFRFNLKLAGARWGKYKREVVDNADFRKFDGALKMIVDGTAVQEESLKSYLESQRQARTLAYGLHRSPEAIMTCLVFTPGQDHAHFVDGSDGGYAMAAKVLKEQIVQFKQIAAR